MERAAVRREGKVQAVPVDRRRLAQIVAETNVTRSPSVSSSVGPGIRPLYAYTSVSAPGRRESRAGAAVIVTSTVPGTEDSF
jgi:hypothetical protein